MLSKTDWLIEQQCSILQPTIYPNMNWFIQEVLLCKYNEDEEADADDPASEVLTDRARQKIRRDLAKLR